MVKYKDVNIVEEFLELLRLAKEEYTYQQLSEILGLPPTVLNRYLKGKVSPRKERCIELINKLRNVVDVSTLIKNKIRMDSYGFIDMSKVLMEVSLLKSAARKLISEFKLHKGDIDVVLTAAVDGIPFAVVLADILDAKLVYAKKKKEIGIQKFYEVTYLASSSGILESLYIPREAIKPGDSILIIDDFIRTGETQRALYKIAVDLKGEPKGMGSIVGIKSGIVQLERELKIPVRAVVYL